MRIFPGILMLITLSVMLETSSVEATCHGGHYAYYNGSRYWVEKWCDGPDVVYVEPAPRQSSHFLSNLMRDIF